MTACCPNVWQLFHIVYQIVNNIVDFIMAAVAAGLAHASRQRPATCATQAAAGAPVAVEHCNASHPHTNKNIMVNYFVNCLISNP
jgi:hypothetical protein